MRCSSSARARSKATDVDRVIAGIADQLLGELQQLLVAGRMAATVAWSMTAPVAAATTAAVWVCSWVSTPMTGGCT